ncbi:MAG TPA: hypothetical protein VKE74_02925, partial [Gemmataceae bacterium]|nr:hypothetical protein [Gemmataceae bacterium]
MQRGAITVFGVAAVAGLTAGLLAFSPGELVRAAEPAAPEAAQPPGGAAADLALVPADALGFVHVQLAELWKDEMFAGFRKTWEAAGPKALAALDQQFVPAPSTISRITGFLLLDEQRKQPQPFVVLAFSAAFEPAAVVKANMP